MQIGGERGVLKHAREFWNTDTTCKLVIGVGGVGGGNQTVGMGR